MSEGEMIQVLVSKWLEYARLKSNHSIKEFSRWLYKRENDADRSSQNASQDSQALLAKQMELGYLFGRMSNFSDLWGKLAFKDLPIIQFEDYAILQEVRQRKNPTKKHLADLLVNEKSTAFEIIKRLIRDGLLSEKLDNKDRRIRRVQLTPYGEEVLSKANDQAKKAAILLMGETTEKDIDTLIQVFRDLNEFHTHLHNHIIYKTIDDLVQSLRNKGTLS